MRLAPEKDSCALPVSFLIFCDSTTISGLYLCIVERKKGVPILRSSDWGGLVRSAENNFNFEKLRKFFCVVWKNCVCRQELKVRWLRSIPRKVILFWMSDLFSQAYLLLYSWCYDNEIGKNVSLLVQNDEGKPLYTVFKTTAPDEGCFRNATFMQDTHVNKRVRIAARRQKKTK